MQNYVEALVSHFEQHPIDLNKEYVWPPRGSAIPYDDTFARRAELSARFLREPKSRSDLAVKMIKWGGITRGIDKIPQMARECPEQLISRGKSRVASWSKIIALHDPKYYLIFDARVAFSLNYIFLHSNCSGGYFPMVPSRNPHIVDALKSLNARGIRLSLYTDSDDQTFYRDYLNLAHETATRLSTPAWHVEMALFARGPELAKSVTVE